MIVELDIFSGRPNPRWSLSESENAELARLIESLQPAASPPSLTPPGLGYRGFRLRDGTGSTWFAYGGFVQSPRGWLADPERSIERFLGERLPAEYESLRPALD
jgi:hypothetical protein